MDMGIVDENEASQMQFFIFASFTLNSVYLNVLSFRLAMTAGEVSCTGLTSVYY